MALSSAAERLAALVRSALPLGCGLAELGWHHLRDVAAPEQVFQLTTSSSPPSFHRWPPPNATTTFPPR